MRLIEHPATWRVVGVLVGLFVCAVPQTAAAASALAAARVGDFAAALTALDEGADPNEPASDGTSALHWAVYYDHVELVERLLDAGAAVEAVNDYGSSPLTEAAVVGNPAVIQRLLDAAADPDLRGTDGQTPLMIVARTPHVDAAKSLLDAGADPNAREEWRHQTAVIWAAAQSQPEMIRLLLEYGADPDARSKINRWERQVSAERRRMYRPYGGMTALMYAAREGCVECARALVEGGANPDLGGPRNETPLIVAINNFRFDVAAYLIEAGADVDKWDWWGRSPLYSAVDMNTIPQGGRPDLRSTDETTSLELIERLLAAGANPDLQLKLTPPYRHRGDDRGCDGLLTTGATAALRAAKTFDVEALRLLIAHGANLELPTDTGVTPLMAAAGYGSLECDIRGYGPGIPHYQTDDVEDKSIDTIQVLLEAGAQLNARTTGGGRGKGPGQTALFGAAFWGWNSVVEFLVEQGAVIDAVDSEGRSAVDAALGRAGGHDRGSAIVVFEETAQRLRDLCAAQAECALPVVTAAAAANSGDD